MITSLNFKYCVDLHLTFSGILCVYPKVPGKGVCGGAEFAAAKEISRKSSSKLDEEGIELAVCRHGTILRGLNMFRGEIYAYALYLQKELGNTATFGAVWMG